MTTTKTALSRRALLGTFAALGALALLPVESRAASLNQMLASGDVGEGYDGFLRARKSSANGFVEEVNAQRRQIYQKRAQETGQTVEVVGKIYAAELYKKAAPGTWFLLENGNWVQK